MSVTPPRETVETNGATPPCNPESLGGAGGGLPLVLMPTEVVALLRLDEMARNDGSIRKRAMADTLRSLDHLHRTGQLCRLPGCSRRYSRDAVLEYLHRSGAATK